MCVRTQSRARTRKTHWPAFSHGEGSRREREFSRDRRDLRFREMETRTPGDSRRARKRGLDQVALNARTHTNPTRQLTRRSYYTMSLFGPAWAPCEAAADRNAKHREASPFLRAVACRKWSRELNTFPAAFVRSTRRVCISTTLGNT